MFYPGKVTAYDGGKVLVYVLKSGYDGVSFLIENASSHPLVVQCDCSKSKNVVSHRGKLSHEETIAPGADVVMHSQRPRGVELDLLAQLRIRRLEMCEWRTFKICRNRMF